MIGIVLGGRYEIIEEIGSGGMAIVYKAHCRLLNRYVAVKLLREEFAGDEEFIARFNVEAQAAASLSHPNIVSIYDVGSYNNTKYIVMEYVLGVTLKQYIAREGMLSWRESLDFSIQICKALEHAHKNNIIHRDIKPHNIIVTQDGTLKVTDFGIARASTAATVTISGNTIGSVHYFSPEQARGGYTDDKSDIYSLGIVMYEMVTGRVPFNGDSPIAVAIMHIQQSPPSPKDFNVTIPLSIEGIIMKAIQKSQSDRYPSAAAMLDDLYAAEKQKDLPIGSADDSPFAGTLKIPAVVPPEGENEGIIEVAEEIPPEPPEDEEQGEVFEIPEVSRFAPDELEVPAIVQNKDDLDALFGESGEKRAYTSKRKGAEKRVDRKRKEGKENDTQNNRTPIVLGIVVALVMVLIVTCATIFTLFPSLLPWGGGTLREVPDIRGMDVEVARQMYGQDRFVINVIRSENHPDLEAGRIISQDPESPKNVKVPFTIKVVTSLGAKSIMLENYTGKEERETALTLEGLGLRAEVVKESSETVPEGYVIRTSPAERNMVPLESTVVLYVSSGLKEKEAVMPSLSGLSRTAAEKALTDMGFKLGKVTTQNSSAAVDTVVWQSVAANVDSATGTEVDIAVSNGRNAPIDTIRPSGTPIRTATPAPTAQVKTRSINIAVPQDKEQTSIKVVADGKIVHNKVHNKSEGAVDVEVSGINSVKVEVYYDDVLEIKNDNVRL